MTRQTARHEDDRDIHTTDARPGDVLIHLTHPYSNVDGRITRLVVEDRISGQTLVEANLTAEQFRDLLSSIGTTVSGAQLPAHPERIGKRSQNISTAIPRGGARTPEEVRDAYLANGWETARIDRTNYGHRVVAYRWIDDATEG